MDLPAGALFVANTGAAAWLADRWSRRLLPGASGAERWLTGFLLFASLTQTCLMALGLAGVLSALAVAGSLGALVMLDACLGRPARGAAPEARDDTPAWPLTARLIMLGVCGWSAWAILGSPTLFGWDTLTYHAVAPAWWIQHGTLDLAPLNYQSYYPLNAEVATLWYMLAHRTDAFANLAMVAWMGILVTACLVNARRLGHAPLLAAAALTCFLLSPDVQERLPYFTSGDLAMAGTLMAMLAFAWVPTGVPTGVPAGEPAGEPATVAASCDTRRPLARALLSGLAGGLALGLKPTAAPYLALAGLCWMARRRGGPGAPWWARVGLFTLGAALTGSFWYLRNLVLTGNPLFPAEIGPFEGPFTAEAQRSTSLLPMILDGWSSLETWWTLFEGLLDWPLWLGLLSVAGIVSGAWAAVRDEHPARRAHLRLILGFALLFLVLFPMQPFSGMANRPVDTTILLLPRYITFPFLAGLLLLPSAWAVRRSAAGDATPGARRLPRWAVPLLVFFVLVGLALDAPRREDRTHDALQDFLGSGWIILETFPPGTRVAVFTRDPPSHSPYSPLFGRELQHEPIAVNMNGTPRAPMHESWRKAPQDWWWEFDVNYRLKGPRLLKNLEDSGVQVVVLQDWPPTGLDWEPEPFTTRRLIADELDPGRLLYRDRITEVWDLDGRFAEARAALRQAAGRNATPDDPPPEQTPRDDL